MALSRRQRQYMGVRAAVPPDMVFANRDPVSTDVAFVKGTLWLNLTGNTAFMYSGTSGLWIALGSGTSGGVVTINSLTPSAGNIVIAGTSNQIGVASSGHTVTLSLPSSVVAPGSVTATTTLTATLGAITATNGNLVLGTAGNGVRVKSGSNARIGVGAVLIDGALEIANTSITANTVVLLSITSLGTVSAPQALYVTKDAGVKFTVTSADETDTSTFDWYLVEAT